MQNVLLYPNTTKQNLCSVVSQCCETLHELGFHVLLQESTRTPLQGCELAHARFLPEREAIKACDFIASVGGDGTVLRIAHLAARYDKPILGVNNGTIGFMNELELSELPEIARLLRGDFRFETRMMLDVSVQDEAGQKKFSAVALNDAVISKSQVARIISLTVELNGRERMRLDGDGVIVCTPTGSTAYSMSAGGAIIEPATECIGITPICPHVLSAKPLVVSQDHVVQVMPHRSEAQISVSVDGRRVCPVYPGDRITIRRAEKGLWFIRLKDGGFYQVVVKKLFDGRS